MADDFSQDKVKVDLEVLRRFSVLLIVFELCQEKKKSFQDVLAHIRCVFASTSCSLPSMRPFPAANAQVFGHIPTMLSPYSQAALLGYCSVT